MIWILNRAVVVVNAQRVGEGGIVFGILTGAKDIFCSPERP
jgi:hypothetical protein